MLIQEKKPKLDKIITDLQPKGKENTPGLFNLAKKLFMSYHIL